MIYKEYGVGCYIDFPLIKRGVQDFAASGDYTHASGDVKISIDGGTAATATNAPAAITMGNGTMWRLQLAAAELQGKTITVTVIDASTKVIEDQMITIETYGHRLAQHPHLGRPTGIYAAAATGTLTVDEFTSGLTGYSDIQLRRRVVTILSGNRKGERCIITDYTSTGGKIKVAPPLTGALANADEFVIE